MAGTRRRCWQEETRQEWGQPRPEWEPLSLEQERQQELELGRQERQRQERQRQEWQERQELTVWEPQGRP